MHGGYSLLVRAGELPENRKHIRAYLSAARAGLIKDQGPTEQDLTAAQVILIDRTVTALGIVRCIEEYIRENSVMKGQDVAPALQQSYLAYVNHIRLNLAALGIKTRAGEGVLDLGAYIKAKDAEKSRAKVRTGSHRARQGEAEAGKGSEPPAAGFEIVPLRASSEEISGQGSGGIDDEAPDGQDQATLEREIAELEARKRELLARHEGKAEGERP